MNVFKYKNIFCLTDFTKRAFAFSYYYFLPALLMSQKIIATITTTITIPTQTPALKIPAIASQLVKVTAMKIKEKMTDLMLRWFIFYGFKLLIIFFVK